MITKTKLSWEKFSPLFSTWARQIKPFFDSGKLDEIFSYLKSNKEEIFPNSKDLWKPFQLCDYSELKAVIAVDGPYLDERGDGLGLSYSIACYESVPLPEALQEVYGAIEREIYELCLECIQEPKLDFLAGQGILLLNCPLTGDRKNGPHRDVWDPFIKHLFQEAIAYTGVPVVFIGEEIWKYQEFLAPWQERFMLEYPKTGWNSKGAFGKINKILKENNGDELQWMQKLPF